jgi:quercetin dioxygenase-like cupin family protein
MKIVRGREAGQPSEHRTATFVGEVWAETVLRSGGEVTVHDVFFQPGARTNWHRHELGQVLYVKAGSGWLQTRAGDGGPLTPGDIAHIPAGEEHWHGGTPDTYLMHLAVSIGTTDWLDPVSEEDYAGAFD